MRKLFAEDSTAFRADPPVEGLAVVAARRAGAATSGARRPAGRRARGPAATLSPGRAVAWSSSGPRTTSGVPRDSGDGDEEVVARTA
jgi:hypothetical protein